MEPSIEEALAYEIKKELADRYFGFRKLIEDDKLEFGDQIRQQAAVLENQICLELARIHTLLNDDDLIVEFMDLVGWQARPCCGPCPKGTPALAAGLFRGLRPKGFTRAGRFKNLLMDSYGRLVGHVEQYRQALAELMENQAAIAEEIKVFYRKNDLAGIMEFLRSLEGKDGLEAMPVVGEEGLREHYTEKMRINPPAPVELQLPAIPPLAALPAMRRALNKLADKAYRLHHAGFMASLLQ